MDRRSKKSLSSRSMHTISIQSFTAIADGEGGFTNAWSTTGTVWGSFSPISAKQQNDYRSTGVDATHIVEVDGLIEIAEDDRLVVDGRTLEILYIENYQEADRLKVITCKEVR